MMRQLILTLIVDLTREISMIIMTAQFCFGGVTILYENGPKRSFNGLMIGTYRLKHVIELGINPLPFYKEIS